jgi:hypothetical protein
MKILVSLKNALRIYAAMAVMILAGAWFHHRHFTVPNEEPIVRPGTITVEVKGITLPTPTETKSQSATEPTVEPATAEKSSAEIGWWETFTSWIKHFVITIWGVVWRVLFVLIIGTIIGMIIETAVLLVFLKKDPMPGLKDYALSNCLKWLWGKCKRTPATQSPGGNAAPAPPSPKKDEKGKKGFWAQVGSGISKLFSVAWKSTVVIAVLVFLTLLVDPRFVIAKGYAVYHAITGESSQRVEKLLVETAPAIDKMSEEEKEKRHILPQQEAWRMERIFAANEGITGSKPAPYVAHYFMSDQIAFEIEMLEAGSGEQSRLVLYHQHSGELKGWWQKIGGRPITKPGERPTWYATVGPDGSYGVNMMDSESRNVFYQYRIYKLRNP